MSMKTLLVVTALSLIGIACASAQVSPPASRAPLQVSIAIPIHGGERRITVGPNSRFQVVVTNTSNKTQRLWRDWCSWGYFNLTLEQVDAKGHAVLIKKKERPWTKNYPDAVELPAGEHYVLEVQLSDSEWELPGKGQLSPKSSLRAVYQIPEDAETKAQNVWTGKVISPVLTYVVADNRP